MPVGFAIFVDQPGMHIFMYCLRNIITTVFFFSTKKCHQKKYLFKAIGMTFLLFQFFSARLNAG